MRSDQPERRRRGRLALALMTLIAIAASREAAFARNKARFPLSVPTPRQRDTASSTTR